MSSSVDELRDIIAAQSKAIQDLTATLLTLTTNGRGPRDEPPSSPPVPMMMHRELIPESLQGMDMSMPRVVKYRIPKDFIVGGDSEKRTMNIRRAAI
jgi:hypothetical protein